MELERFVNSLNRQEGIDFSTIQLIFVDQGENKEVFDKLNSQIEFQYIKSERCSLSHARNIGLQYVKGIYVGYPDDDCWYEPYTLKKALAVLEEGKYQGVTGKGTNEEGKLTAGFPERCAELTTTKRCAAISYTMFYKYQKGVYFDENIGVGSPYNLGSGEETDYMLTLMENYKYRILYSPEMIVHHPIQTDIYSEEFLLRKFYSYARGGGYLMRKHEFPISYKLKNFIRPFCGIFVNAIKGKRYDSKKSWYNLKGRVEGYNFKLKIDMNNYLMGGAKFLKNTNLPVLKQIREAYIEVRDKLIERKRLQYIPRLKKHFPEGISVVSNNCFAGRIYQDLHLPYLSPTAGLTILYPDYITFLEKLEYYKSAPLQWVETSKFPRGEEMRKTWKHWYPIALIGGDLEIHFLHYHTKEEAEAKWIKRCSRIDMNNLYVVAAAQGNCTEDMVARFAKLPYKKLFLVKEQYKTKYPDVIYVPEFVKYGADPYRQAHIYYKYMLNHLDGNI